MEWWPNRAPSNEKLGLLSHECGVELPLGRRVGHVVKQHGQQIQGLRAAHSHVIHRFGAAPRRQRVRQEEREHARSTYLCTRRRRITTHRKTRGRDALADGKLARAERYTCTRVGEPVSSRIWLGRPKPEHSPAESPKNV